MKMLKDARLLVAQTLLVTPQPTFCDDFEYIIKIHFEKYFRLYNLNHL